MEFDLGTLCVVLCDVVRKYESFPELIFVEFEIRPVDWHPHCNCMSSDSQNDFYN